MTVIATIAGEYSVGLVSKEPKKNSLNLVESRTKLQTKSEYSTYIYRMSTAC